MLCSRPPPRAPRPVSAARRRAAPPRRAARVVVATVVATSPGGGRHDELRVVSGEVHNVLHSVGHYAGLSNRDRAAFAPLKAAELAAYFVGKDDHSPRSWWAADGIAHPWLDGHGRLLPTGHVCVLRRRANCGAAAARDEGLRVAQQAGIDVCLMVDADCAVDAGWAVAHLAAQAAAPGIVCGVTRAAGCDDVLRFHDACGHLNPRVDRSSRRVVYGATCNMSVSLSRLHALEGGHFFDVSFPGASYEDIEMCVRNLDAGVSITMCTAATATHQFCSPGEDPVDALVRRFRRYGASEHLLVARHPRWTPARLYEETAALPLSELQR